MRSQNCSVNQVGGFNHYGVESFGVVAFNGERDRVGFELGLESSIASDVVHKHDTGKLMVNLVVEIAGDEPAGIEDRDRCLWHSSWPSQLSDQGKDHMGRRVQTIDRVMTRRVVQVGLDCHFLASLVPGVAATMSAIEILEDGAPCLGIAFLNCKTPDGARDHAVNYSLAVVGVFPPGTCPIPCHSRRVMRPGHSTGNHA